MTREIFHDISWRYLMAVLRKLITGVVIATQVFWVFTATFTLVELGCGEPLVSFRQLYTGGLPK